MPFLKDLSPMQKSCRNQIKISPSEKDEKAVFFSPDEDTVYADKKGILLHLRKASLTVEAAFVLPVFFMAVICMASVMGIYSRTLEKMVSLRGYAQTAAAAAGISDETFWIDIPGNISFTPLFLPEGIKMFDVICAGSARAWTGRDEASFSEEDFLDEAQYVYVTENGEVYHTFSDCTHIDLSISAAGISAVENLRNENGGRYSACEKCPDENGTDTVYITQYGDRYHSSLSCSGLKRSVRLVEISKAEGLSECERCASRR